jgi:hypothetical protein
MSALDAQQFTVKFYAQRKLQAEDFVPVFHEWIQEERITDDVAIDVTSYSHVKDGPGVLLIGHGGDYAIDRSDGRCGLRFAKKRNAANDPHSRLREVFRRALQGVSWIESDRSLGVKFDMSEVVFSIRNRLLAPNGVETVGEVAPVLRSFIGDLYETDDVTLEHIDDARDVFALRARARTSHSAKTLAERLS